MLLEAAMPEIGVAASSFWRWWGCWRWGDAPRPSAGDDGDTGDVAMRRVHPREIMGILGMWRYAKSIRTFIVVSS
jgi:hypothetical protein